MFKPLQEVSPQASVSITFEGRSVIAPKGSTVAAALLGNGIIVNRHSPVSGAGRGPFCMMGTCFECLVRIDGVSVQACQVQVREGLIVEKVAVDDH